MCGIVGYIGDKSANEKVYDCLKRLEYRGYDSAGICCLESGNFYLEKSVGEVSRLLPYLKNLKGNIGIGHTRWATHGEVKRENAHPHLSKNFAIVHNGIIENYAPLKEWLSGLDVCFSSDTDSEIVAHLLDYYYDQGNDFLSAVKLAVQRLKGAYALLILHSDSKEICAVKNKSPLIVGKGKGGVYAGSDAVALVDGCEDIYRLKDGEIAMLGKEEITVYDGNLNKANAEFERLEIDESTVGTDGYAHFMLKEIAECPRTVKDSAQNYFKNHYQKVKEFIAGVNKIIIVGCGTAYNAGLVGKIYFEDTARVPCEVAVASEMRYSNPIVDKDTLVIAISQSGETADTIEACKLLKSLGTRVMALTCVEYSSITTVADVVVGVSAGREICVAATKSYCGQIAVLYCICSTFCFSAERSLNNLLTVADKMGKVLFLQPELKGVADECAKKKAVFFLGRGKDFAVAEEGSLKLKEVSYIFCDGYASGELKHGTLALIDENTLSIVIMSDETSVEKGLNTIEQILSRKGEVAVVTTISCLANKLPKGVKECVLLPDYSGALSPLLTSVALQYVAYYSATNRGLNPDKPRNLAKSVTVE